MKIMKSYIRSAALLLALLMLCQGCSLYKGSITLDEAVTTQKKVKVITKQNPKPFEFKRIEYTNGEYKGIPKRYSKSGEDVVIKKEDITQIKEYDKTASNIVTFSPLVLILALGIILFSSGE